MFICSQVRFNLLQYILPEVKELYNWLEMDFHPLKLSGRVTKVGGPTLEAVECMDKAKHIYCRLWVLPFLFTK